MEDVSITLADMLLAREQRYSRQQKMLNESSCAIISFSINIPGEIKTNPAIIGVFDDGMEKLKKCLTEKGIRFFGEISQREAKTGPESVFAADADPKILKLITCAIENEHLQGRLMDFDVIDKDGTKVSRTDVGFDERRCFVCGKPAFICARSRAHTQKQLDDQIARMLGEK